MHTPRLCIDVRAAAEFAAAGMVAQEVVDQLVAAQGEPGASSEWLERARTVLVAHKGQLFSGQLKRFDTGRRIGRSPLYWLWERSLVRGAKVSAFHRFRPIDRLAPHHACQTLTTVLPAARKLPFFLSRRGNHRLVVPSEKDARLLRESYHFPEDRIHVVRPGVRRFIHFTPAPKRPVDGRILFVGGRGMKRSDQKRLEAAIRATMPETPSKRLRLARRADLSPQAWAEHLKEARLVVYLETAPFDWATLALESLYWGVPTLFADGNRALAELLPGSPLSLSRFLVDPPDAKTLKRQTDGARIKLKAAGAFDPYQLARQYRAIYATLTPTID